MDLPDTPGQPLADALAHLALEIAHVAERRAQIMLAKELPLPEKARLFRHMLRDIPSVDAGAAHPAVAARLEFVMDAQVFRQILDEDQPRAPARNIEPG